MMLRGSQGHEAEKLATARFKGQSLLSLVGSSSKRLSDACYLGCQLPPPISQRLPVGVFLSTHLLPGCKCVDAILCHAGGKRQDARGIGVRLQAIRLHRHEMSWWLHNRCNTNFTGGWNTQRRSQEDLMCSFKSL